MLVFARRGCETLGMANLRGGEGGGVASAPATASKTTEVFCADHTSSRVGTPRALPRDMGFGRTGHTEGARGVSPGPMAVMRLPEACVRRVLVQCRRAQKAGQYVVVSIHVGGRRKVLPNKVSYKR